MHICLAILKTQLLNFILQYVALQRKQEDPPLKNKNRSTQCTLQLNMNMINQQYFDDSAGADHTDGFVRGGPSFLFMFLVDEGR